MNTSSSIKVLAVAWSLLATTVFSAEVSTPVQQFDDPDAKSTATGTENRVVLEAGDADAKATIRLANIFNTGSTTFGRFAFTVSAPFDSKKAESVDVGTLSGLTAGTSANFEYSVWSWPDAEKDPLDVLTKLCVDAIPKLIPGYDWKTLSRVSNAVCERALFDVEQLNARAKIVNEKRKQCPKCQGTGDCTPAQLKICELLKDRPEAKLVDDAAAQIAVLKPKAETAAKEARTQMYGVTFGAKANHQNFSFVLPAAPTTAEKSDETGAGLSLGFTYVGVKNLFTAGYSHEESYKASGKVQVCSPIGTTGSLACKEVSLGAPKKEKAELGYLEAKRIIKAGRFAVAPRVEYDFKESNYAVRVPLYFIANKEHQLTAGVALGYTDADDEGFGAAVFVSKAFAFFE